MLAITQFPGALSNGSPATQASGTLKVKFCAGNKSPNFARRNDHNGCESPFANWWLLPEAALIEAICEQQKEDGIKAETCHARGHQDSTAEVTKLTSNTSTNERES